MKHQDVIDLNNNLLKVKGLIGFEVNFAIKKNIHYSQIEVNIFSEQEKEIMLPLAKFNEEKEAIQKKYSTIDGDVKYIDVAGKKNFDMTPENKKLAEKEIGKLLIKYKKVINSVEKAHNEFTKNLREKDSKYKIVKVKSKYVPKDISTENMEYIFDIIEEEK